MALGVCGRSLPTILCQLCGPTSLAALRAITLHSSGNTTAWSSRAAALKLSLYFLPHFVRIRLNNSESESLVVPVEVEVSSAPGFYFPTDALDFGLLRSDQGPKELELQLLSSLQKPATVQVTFISAVCAGSGGAK